MYANTHKHALTQGWRALSVLQEPGSPLVVHGTSGAQNPSIPCSPGNTKSTASPLPALSACMCVLYVCVWKRESGKGRARRRDIASLLICAVSCLAWLHVSVSLQTGNCTFRWSCSCKDWVVHSCITFSINFWVSVLKPGTKFVALSVRWFPKTPLRKKYDFLWVSCVQCQAKWSMSDLGNMEARSLRSFPCSLTPAIPS